MDTAPALFTAFEPFGGATVNASQVVAERLIWEGSGIELLILPVTREAGARLSDRLANLPAPRWCISLGEAGRAREVRLEAVGRNIADFRIPDNSGDQPRAEAIVPGGPETYPTTFDVERIAQTLAGRTPLPVVVSQSAGEFVCNHTAYSVLAALAGRENAPPYGFIHIPAWRPGDGDAALAGIILTVEAVLAQIDALPVNRL